MEREDRRGRRERKGFFLLGQPPKLSCAMEKAGAG